MSQAVFPVLPGLKWDIKKTPTWNTSVQQSVGGKELRASFFQQPIWHWVLAFEFLRTYTPPGGSAYTEFQTLAGFFNARQGSYDSFLYTDPYDSVIPDVTPYMAFGTGNGSRTAFQLTRSLGGVAENVYDLNGTPKIYVDNVLKATPGDYTISASGLVTFVSPPANTKVVAWSGAYYWRVRFAQDAAEFNQFAATFWDLQQLEFVSVK